MIQFLHIKYIKPKSDEISTQICRSNQIVQLSRYVIP